VDRPVVQLEGIVNNREYVNVLKNGGLASYLCQNDVDYVVTHTWSNNEKTQATRNGRWTQNLNYTVREDEIIYRYNTSDSNIDANSLIIASTRCDA
jgi:hypothetical protein